MTKNWLTSPLQELLPPAQRVALEIEMAVQKDGYARALGAEIMKEVEKAKKAPRGLLRNHRSLDLNADDNLRIRVGLMRQ